jgi:hypothetical protein
MEYRTRSLKLKILNIHIHEDSIVPLRRQEDVVELLPHDPSRGQRCAVPRHNPCELSTSQSAQRYRKILNTWDEQHSTIPRAATQKQNMTACAISHVKKPRNGLVASTEYGVLPFPPLQYILTYGQAHQAYERGDGAAAHQLSEEGKKHAAQMDRYNKQASDFIFRENNAEGRVGPDTIDLHGQYVQEAEEILEKRLRYAQAQGQSGLHV